LPPDSDNAYNANMNNGNINNDNKDNDNNKARCVREHKPCLSLMVSYEEVYNAYLRCRKGKRNKYNTLKFEKDLELNLLEITESINNKTYEIKRSISFAIKYPKPREIIAADFKDRIVHHLVFTSLNPIYEKKFIFDSYACRKNKGTLKAIKRLQNFLRSITLNGKNKAYFLQLDIHNFFMSIDKNILFKLVLKQIKDEEIKWLIEKIIFHNPLEKNIIKNNLNVVPFHKRLINQDKKNGLPIGNLTSQFFANIYLNELDQFIKHKLKVKYYLRYVDDFVLLSLSKDELILYKQKIELFLQENLNLKLKPLVKISAVSNGINFVGAIVKQSHLLSRNRNVYEMNKKINLLLNTYPIKLNLLRASINSYFGGFKHFSSKKIMALTFKKNPLLRYFFRFNKEKVDFKWEK
jgi:RNA-directed DNA polymerase